MHVDAAGQYDLIVCNYANGDMVGHTGNLEAAIEAVECLDQCIGEVVQAIQDSKGQALITADHGNCETMVNPDGTPHTAHTTNPVPIILIDKDLKHIKDGILGDLAPTILDLMGLPQPKIMTQSSLLS